MEYNGRQPQRVEQAVGFRRLPGDGDVAIEVGVGHGHQRQRARTGRRGALHHFGDVVLVEAALAVVGLALQAQRGGDAEIHAGGSCSASPRHSITCGQQSTAWIAIAAHASGRGSDMPSAIAGERDRRHQETRARVGEPGQRDQQRGRPQADALRACAARAVRRAARRSSGPNVPVSRSPNASSQGTCAGSTSPSERRSAGQFLLRGHVKIGVREDAAHQRRHRIPGDHQSAHHPRRDHQRRARGHHQRGTPAPLRRHEQHRARRRPPVPAA